MVLILKYILLGIIFYILIIPIIEELATVIVQGLEVIKGGLVLKLAYIQEKAEKLSESKQTNSTVHAIGFTVTEDDNYEEEDEDDD